MPRQIRFYTREGGFRNIAMSAKGGTAEIVRSENPAAEECRCTTRVAANRPCSNTYSWCYPPPYQWISDGNAGRLCTGRSTFNEKKWIGSDFEPNINATNFSSPNHLSNDPGWNYYTMPPAYPNYWEMQNWNSIQGPGNSEMSSLLYHHNHRNFYPRYGQENNRNENLEECDYAVGNLDARQPSANHNQNNSNTSKQRRKKKRNNKTDVRSAEKCETESTMTKEEYRNKDKRENKTTKKKDMRRKTNTTKIRWPQKSASLDALANGQFNKKEAVDLTRISAYGHNHNNNNDTEDSIGNSDDFSEWSSQSERSSEDASSEDASSEDASSEDASSEDASSEDASSEDASSENASSENASYEDASSEDVSSVSEVLDYALASSSSSSKSSSSSSSSPSPRNSRIYPSNENSTRRSLTEPSNRNQGWSKLLTGQATGPATGFKRLVNLHNQIGENAMKDVKVALEIDTPDPPKEFRHDFDRFFKIIRSELPLGGPAIFLQVSRTAVQEKVG